MRGLPPRAPLDLLRGDLSRARFCPEAPRPGLILNVTNDAWFGDTPGPRQHFAQARLRAVEEGLPLVRAANTGISAVVDPYGRILARCPGVEGVLDARLPRSSPPTIFARWERLVAFWRRTAARNAAGAAALIATPLTATEVSPEGALEQARGL